MSTIIRATDRNRGTHTVAYNFEDMAGRADRYLAKVRAEAAKIVARAQQEAEAAKARAVHEGRQAGRREIEQLVGKQLSTVLPALKQAIADIQDAKQAWLTHWEASAVRVATAIAARLIRRELSHWPRGIPSCASI